MSKQLKGTIWRLAVFLSVCALGTFALLAVFAEFRFDVGKTYFAQFSNVSNMRKGSLVRIAGVEVGKVRSISVNRDSTVRVEFSAENSVVLTEGSRAVIRYDNLFGDRYLALEEGAGGVKTLQPGDMIPLARTEPALDLDAVIGGFRPLFRALDPEKVNTIAQSIITVFQGQGGTINDILDQTASLTAALADRDQAIGEVIRNLNTVLDTTVRHQEQFDETLVNFERLITGLKNRADPIASSVADISDAAGTVADLLTDNRPVLQDTVGYLDAVQQPLVDQKDQLNDILSRLPSALKIIGRAGGIYGDFFNFYLCDISLKLNGLQPGGPVRTVRVTSQPSGRCTPK